MVQATLWILIRPEIGPRGPKKRPGMDRFLFLLPGGEDQDEGERRVNNRPHFGPLLPEREGCRASLRVGTHRRGVRTSVGRCCRTAETRQSSSSALPFASNPSREILCVSAPPRSSSSAYQDFQRIGSGLGSQRDRLGGLLEGKVVRDERTDVGRAVLPHRRNPAEQQLCPTIRFEPFAPNPLRLRASAVKLIRVPGLLKNRQWVGRPARSPRRFVPAESNARSTDGRRVGGRKPDGRLRPAR